MKKNFKNFFIITVPITILLFLLLEIIVRIFFDHIDYYDNPMDYWSEPSPYSAFTAKPGTYGKKTVNKYGFVSTPEISLSKPDSVVRIVFLGGSSTAGMGVNLEDKETWPWKTVEALKKLRKDIRFDFINAALGAYTTFDSYGRLWSRIRFFNPDIIVVNHGWNEMYYFNEIADNPLLWRKEGYYEQSYIGWNEIKLKLLSLSQVLVRTKLAMEKVANEEGEIGENKGLANKMNLKGLKILEDNYNLIESFAEKSGCKIFFCKQPSLITSNTKESDKARCNYEFHGFNHEEHVKAFELMYALIDKKIDKKYTIDLTSISGITENFYDHIHPTKKGTDEIAKVVADSLNRNFEFDEISL